MAPSLLGDAEYSVIEVLRSRSPGVFGANSVCLAAFGERGLYIFQIHCLCQRVP